MLLSSAYSSPCKQSSPSLCTRLFSTVLACGPSVFTSTHFGILSSWKNFSFLRSQFFFFHCLSFSSGSTFGSFCFLSRLVRQPGGLTPSQVSVRKREPTFSQRDLRRQIWMFFKYPPPEGLDGSETSPIFYPRLIPQSSNGSQVTGVSADQSVPGPHSEIEFWFPAPSFSSLVIPPPLNSPLHPSMSPCGRCEAFDMRPPFLFFFPQKHRVASRV